MNNEDLSIFFQSDEHGTTATYQGNDVHGIFDDEYQDVSGVSDSDPMFTCAESDVTDPVGNTITINSVIYTIRDTHPDGTGVTTLHLEAP
jgi:hypothetical protein